jgi:fructose-1,6-bisphosphatase/inositol monophosphatase family enzyme
MNDVDQDSRAGRERLMLMIADFAASCSHQFNDLKDGNGGYLSREIAVDAVTSGVRNRATARLREMYDAPVYLADQPEGPWARNEAWLISAVDGLDSLRRGGRRAAVAFALLRNGHPIVSAVSPLFSTRRYMAGRNIGAWSQEWDAEPKRIAVSRVGSLAESVLSFGLPEEHVPGAIRAIVELKGRGSRLRSRHLAGCTSLDLVDIARGEAQGHFEANVAPAAVAAGRLILQAAGGETTDWQGHRLEESGTLRANFAATGSPAVHQEMLRVLSTIKTGSEKGWPVQD